MPLNVLFAGGGTTGHVSPMLAIARELRFQEPEAGILMLGTPEGLETTLVPDAGFALELIDKVPAPRKLNSDLFSFPTRLRRTIKQVKTLLKDHEIDVVVGVGGYVSSPAYLAARSLKLPIVIHEANARPGMANKLGARFTAPANIGYAFAGTPMAGEQVGMPMRIEIERLDYFDVEARRNARTRLGLDPDKRTVVVTGGSLGAASINEAMAAAAAEFAAAGIQVLHITGAGKAKAVREAVVGHADYHVTEYVDGMENAYLSADLLICRSGAGTVAEVSVMRTPALYVPLPIGNGEQKLNAADAVKAGAAELVDNADFTLDFVRGHVLDLVADAHRLSEMCEAADRMRFPMHAARAMVEKTYAAAGAAHPHRERPASMLTRTDPRPGSGASANSEA